MADPIKKVAELQLGPVQTDEGRVLAINQLQRKLNEVIRRLNEVIDRINV